MANLNIQIGHVGGQGGASYEEETLKLIVPHVEARLRAAGHKVTHYDGSLQRESARGYQHGGDGTLFCHCDSDGAGNSYSIGYWEEEHPGSGALAVVLRDTYRSLGIPWNAFNITGGEWHYYGNTRFAHSCKCCLIEFGFVSNPGQRAFLQAQAQRVGYTAADAYIKFFGGIVPPKPEEEDTMVYAVVPFVEVEAQDGRHVYVAAEGWWDLPDKRAQCFLLMKNEGPVAAQVSAFTTPNTQEFKFTVPPKSDQGSRFIVDMATRAPKGGFATTVKSTVPLVCQMSILGDKKK